jgi:uncharacterized protein (DUF58 family)
MRLLRDLFLPNRFFYLLGGLALLLALTFIAPVMFPFALGLLGLAFVIVLIDYFSLFNKKTAFSCSRNTSKVLSLGDDNKISIKITNRSPKAISFQMVDELPVQFQKRDFQIGAMLEAGEEVSFDYFLRPVERGEYHFGNILLYVSSKWGLVERRFVFKADEMVPVYPSIIQMKKYDLKVFENSRSEGMKKLRRIGHSYEFEQIKNYVKGDDYRSINWKATGRKNELMVNQYEDERSQQVYCILDKSRVMKMPFEGLSLLDYSINASLVISNVALQKHDRAGLITFSDIIGNVVPADRKTSHLNKILRSLYHIQEHPLEANYELLYHAVRRLIPQRSLILLFSNFESMYALDRVLPILRKINRFHLLVVVFFENTEIKEIATSKVQTLEGIYTQTVAQKFVYEKEEMVQKLRQYGVQSILTKPQELTVASVNKYLELKSRGLI